MRRARRGFTLIESALLVCLVGILLAVAIPTFVRKLRTSKISEASRQLELIYHRTAAYYTTPQPTPAGKRLRCLPPSAGPTPATPAADPVEVDFFHPETPGNVTWRAIGHQPGEAIRYRYTLELATPGCDAPRPDGGGEQPLITVRAEGDLDADGTLSLFERSASLVDGELVPQPALLVHDRIE